MGVPSIYGTRKRLKPKRLADFQTEILQFFKKHLHYTCATGVFKDRSAGRRGRTSVSYCCINGKMFYSRRLWELEFKQAANRPFLPETFYLESSAILWAVLTIQTNNRQSGKAAYSWVVLDVILLVINIFSQINEHGEADLAA